MARTGFALGSPVGSQFGPINIPAGTEIAGVEAAEQAGHGVVDVRIQYRKNDGTPLPGTGNQTGWAVGLAGNADFIGSILIPADEVFSGLWVQAQAGFGVVNLRLKKRKRLDGSAAPDSQLATSNMHQDAVGEVETPPGSNPEGIVVKVQSSFGVVDMAVEYQ